MPSDWSREEVEATVADYLDMLSAELTGVQYSKTAHRRRLVRILDGRSEQSVEFKHANISAVLIDLGFPFISGYKPRANYQRLLHGIVAERLSKSPGLLEIAAVDADRPMAVPEVDDILSVVGEPPAPRRSEDKVRDHPPFRPPFAVNYLEREARNRSLGDAGEAFVISYERARLVLAGKESLAAKIEHTAKVRGDAEGFDILSYEASGEERFIEVKTTKYGQDTPFFISRNELAVSDEQASRYHLYRLFGFRFSPRMFILAGALSRTCKLSASTYLATVS